MPFNNGNGSMHQNLKPKAVEVPLKGSYKFMYENFVIATQHDLYVLLNKSGDQVSGLKFDSIVFKYGYPNDEVPHPLDQHGLSYYGLFTIENSTWVQEIRLLNSKHPDDGEYFHRGNRHYVIRFKDVSLEVISTQVTEIQISFSELSEIIGQELSDLDFE